MPSESPLITLIIDEHSSHLTPMLEITFGGCVRHSRSVAVALLVNAGGSRLAAQADRACSLARRSSSAGRPSRKAIVAVL